MNNYTQKMELGPFPDEVMDIIRRLQKAGYEAYLVGGTVRDILAGYDAFDYDITTSATPAEVQSLFRRTIPTGIKHGTVTVLGKQGQYEVTTYRCDGDYSDGRHPDEVSFTRSLEEDLKRRDFTINALAYDPIANLLIDMHGGIADFDDRTIRAIGDPARRFAEDGLRPMRAIRFAARFDFAVDPATFAAIKPALDIVKLVSAERIRDELMKMLATSAMPSYGFELMMQCGLLDLILPEVMEGYSVEQNKYHAYTVYLHNLYACDNAPKEQPLIRLAALFHDIGKPRTLYIKRGEATFYNHQVISMRMGKQIMRRLRFSKKDIDYVAHLVYHHMFGYTEEWTDAAIRRFIRKVGREYIEDLFELRIADWFGNGRHHGYPKYLQRLRDRIRRELEKADAFKITDLHIDGLEVMAALKIAPGPEIGNALEYLLQQVLEEPSLNDNETLLKILEAYKIGNGKQ